jgi:hypothetical protein
MLLLETSSLSVHLYHPLAVALTNGFVAWSFESSCLYFTSLHCAYLSVYAHFVLPMQLLFLMFTINK